MPKIKSGFSILELLVVIVLLAAFAWLGISGFEHLRDNDFNEKNRIAAEAFAGALDELYKSGATAQGVSGASRGSYLDVKTACTDTDNIVQQILQKHTNLEPDTQIATIASTSSSYSEDWDFDWSGGHISDLAKSTILGQNGILKAPTNSEVKLLSCSPAQTQLSYKDIINKTTIIYIPSVRYAPKDYCSPGTATCPARNNAVTNCFDKDNLAAGFSLDCNGFLVYYLKKEANQYKLSEPIKNRL